MKKLLVKDKKLRANLNIQEKKYFILKSIFKNLNLFTLLRWNAFLTLKNISRIDSNVAVSNRCVYTINKKRFNNLSPFSRYVFLKLARSGSISGLRKSSW